MTAIATVLTVTVLAIVLTIVMMITAYNTKDVKLLKASVNFIKTVLLSDLVYTVLVLVIGLAPIR